MEQRIDAEKIRSQAKRIMDEFITALGKVENPDSGFGEEREESMRLNATKKVDPEFRKIMFENAPKKSDEYIIAEKKKW